MEYNPKLHVQERNTIFHIEMINKELSRTHETQFEAAINSLAYVELDRTVG